MFDGTGVTTNRSETIPYVDTAAASHGSALFTWGHTFIDDGYSGATLVRPALERLRDLAAAGGVDRVYVHSPDRLARKYAYQVLLLDELATVGVEVVFLNRELGRSPEEHHNPNLKAWRAAMVEAFRHA